MFTEKEIILLKRFVNFGRNLLCKFFNFLKNKIVGFFNYIIVPIFKKIYEILVISKEYVILFLLYLSVSPYFILFYHAFAVKFPKAIPLICYILVTIKEYNGVWKYIGNKVVIIVTSVVFYIQEFRKFLEYKYYAFFNMSYQDRKKYPHLSRLSDKLRGFIFFYFKTPGFRHGCIRFGNRITLRNVIIQALLLFLFISPVGYTGKFILRKYEGIIDYILVIMDALVLDVGLYDLPKYQKIYFGLRKIFEMVFYDSIYVGPEEFIRCVQRNYTYESFMSRRVQNIVTFAERLQKLEAGIIKIGRSLIFRGAPIYYSRTRVLLRNIEGFFFVLPSDIKYNVTINIKQFIKHYKKMLMEGLRGYPFVFGISFIDMSWFYIQKDILGKWEKYELVLRDLKGEIIELYIELGEDFVGLFGYILCKKRHISISFFLGRKAKEDCFVLFVKLGYYRLLRGKVLIFSTVYERWLHNCIHYILFVYRKFIIILSKIGYRIEVFIPECMHPEDLLYFLSYIFKKGRSGKIGFKK